MFRGGDAAAAQQADSAVAADDDVKGHQPRCGEERVERAVAVESRMCRQGRPSRRTLAMHELLDALQVGIDADGNEYEVVAIEKLCRYRRQILLLQLFEAVAAPECPECNKAAAAFRGEVLPRRHYAQ